MSYPIRVADVMSTPVVTAAPDETVSDAAGTFLEEGINSVVIVEDDEAAGIVTGTDLIQALDQDESPREKPLEAVMSAPVAMTGPAAELKDALETMHDHGVARLVVVEDGRLVGLVSTDDVIRYAPQVFHRGALAGESEPTAQYHARQETEYELSDWEFECSTVSCDQLSVGDRVEFSKTISETDVRSFATASGDTNRLHLDESYARETRFGQRIAHGTLVSGLISAALARLPGLTIYVSQDLVFLGPIGLGERVTAVCEIVGEISDRKFELTTDVLNADGERVIEGEATVLVDDLPETAAIEIEAVA
ncbi:CBS domain-containing protein (plasmid) [Natronorubrum bangense]|uniref:CBS domain-containing protein n=3 Tax=Natronorubrum bangense TaxID=61858 RepID=A0A4D6HT15_9EURY|nr:putative signal transduction protein with CBS domains [Natronorubrum bangense JCM 10635]QCC56426.1 CBS domain-containing protein [Natronorubrum bangense]